MHLLGQIDAELYNIVGRLSHEQLLSVVGNIVKVLCKDFKKIETPLQTIIACDRLDALSESSLEDLSVYARSAEKNYFDLKESGKPEIEWGVWFYKARLAAAIGFACESVEREAAFDAIYELCFVREDQQETLSIIHTEIKNVLERKLGS